MTSFFSGKFRSQANPYEVHGNLLVQADFKTGKAIAKLSYTGVYKEGQSHIVHFEFCKRNALNCNAQNITSPTTDNNIPQIKFTVYPTMNNNTNSRNLHGSYTTSLPEDYGMFILYRVSSTADGSVGSCSIL